MRRYREDLDEVEVSDGAPAGFRWRGRTYRVLQVLGHWHEEAGWWRLPDGAARRVERSDLWRVEASGGPAGGVYELVRRGPGWRLDRVWD